MSAKRRGRPPSGNKSRDSEVVFNLTPQDAQWLDATALSLGFKSRSQFLTAIVERLVIAKLAPFAWLKVGWQIHKRAMETGTSKGAGLWNPFREPIPPFDPAAPRPPLPMPDEELAPAETKQLLATIRQELQPK